MSYKRKSRSIGTFPAANRNVEVENIGQNSGTTTAYANISHNVANLNSLPKFSFESKQNKYKGRVLVQEPNSPTNSFSTSGSDLEGILDLTNKLSGLSSSSSLSWSEDYELEITKKVQVELEKLDKAFQGLEEAPPPHDKEEIEEWKYFFPNLCILDHKTPTNSIENSEASSDSEEETLNYINSNHYTISNLKIKNGSEGKSYLVNKRRTEEQAQNFLNTNNRNYHTLPNKLKSLEIEKYLKISSIKSPEMVPRKQKSQPVLTRQASQELARDVSPEYTSLPFIMATPLKTQIRKPPRKTPKLLCLPPIISSSFRSISATPRQASSKSMFVSLNFEKDSQARGEQMSLKSDLMKLFDLIPLSNR